MTNKTKKIKVYNAHEDDNGNLIICMTGYNDNTCYIDRSDILTSSAKNGYGKHTHFIKYRNSDDVIATGMVTMTMPKISNLILDDLSNANFWMDIHPKKCTPYYSCNRNKGDKYIALVSRMAHDGSHKYKIDYKIDMVDGDEPDLADYSWSSGVVNYYNLDTYEM